MRQTAEHKKVGIVILNYNNASATINCLQSIVENTDCAYRKVVVVDNGSADSTISEVNDYLHSIAEPTVIEYDPTVVEPITLSEFTHLLVGKNLGYACGNNCGCELLYRDADVNKILILNNDTLVVENMVERLAERYDTIARCGILTPLIVGCDRSTIDFCTARRKPTLGEIMTGWALLHRNVGGRLSRIAKRQQMLSDRHVASGEIVEIELPSGSCMMIGKDLFREIGGFDTHTFLYYEENILLAKLSKINRRNFVDCSCRCVHLGADTTATQISSMLVARSLCDSVQYYVKRYTNASILYRWTLSLFCLLFRCKVWLKSIF